MSQQDEVTILLVDDDRGHRMLLRRNLERCNVGCNLIEFADGQALLDFFNHGKMDGSLSSRAFLVFLDIRMPKISGVEVLQILKADSYLKRIPIVMVTTTDDPLEVARCHELGCSYYMTKPIEHDQFIAMIRSLGLHLQMVQLPHLE